MGCELTGLADTVAAAVHPGRLQRWRPTDPRIYLFWGWFWGERGGKRKDSRHLSTRNKSCPPGPSGTVMQGTQAPEASLLPTGAWQLLPGSHEERGSGAARGQLISASAGRRELSGSQRPKQCNPPLPTEPPRSLRQKAGAEGTTQSVGQVSEGRTPDPESQA